MSDAKLLHWTAVLICSALGGMVQFAVGRQSAGWAVLATVFLFVFGGITQPEDN